MAQKFLHNNSEETLDVSDEVDSNFEDLDQLRQTVKGQYNFITLYMISYSFPKYQITSSSSYIAWIKYLLNSF